MRPLRRTICTSDHFIRIKVALINILEKISVYPYYQIFLKCILNWLISIGGRRENIRMSIDLKHESTEITSCRSCHGKPKRKVEVDNITSNSNLTS